jgi:hypothetical protein
VDVDVEEQLLNSSSTVQYSTVQYSTVQYSWIFSTAQYSTSQKLLLNSSSTVQYIKEHAPLDQGRSILKANVALLGRHT